MADFSALLPGLDRAVFDRLGDQAVWTSAATGAVTNGVRVMVEEGAEAVEGGRNVILATGVLTVAKADVPAPGGGDEAQTAHGRFRVIAGSDPQLVNGRDWRCEVQRIG